MGSSEKSLHIYDAIRYVTKKPGNKIRHKTWSLGYCVYMTPAGNFKYKTPEGDLYWSWLKSTHPKKGWEVLYD